MLSTFNRSNGCVQQAAIAEAIPPRYHLCFLAATLTGSPEPLLIPSFTWVDILRLELMSKFDQSTIVRNIVWSLYVRLRSCFSVMAWLQGIWENSWQIAWLPSFRGNSWRWEWISFWEKEINQYSDLDWCRWSFPYTVKMNRKNQVTCAPSDYLPTSRQN